MKKINKKQLRGLIQESIFGAIGDAAKSAFGFGAKEKVAPVAPQAQLKELDKEYPFSRLPGAIKEEIINLVNAAYVVSFVRIQYDIRTNAEDRGGNMVYSQDDQAYFSISVGRGTPAAGTIEHNVQKSYDTGQQSGNRKAYYVALGVMELLQLDEGVRERYLAKHYDNKVGPAIEKLLQSKGYNTSNYIDLVHEEIKRYKVPRVYEFGRQFRDNENIKVKASGSTYPGPGGKSGWVTAAYDYPELNAEIAEMVLSGFRFFVRKR